MTGPPPPDWERLAELFDRAVALPPAERDAWLDRELAGEPLLLATLRRMLLADASGEDLLSRGVAPAAGLILEPDDPVQPGDAVGQFDVIGRLGRGGMGVVYEARDRHLGRLAALKFLPAGWPGGSDRAERLVAEAKAAAALDHPNVAGIYQVGTDARGRLFLAMPRYEGETLRTRLERGPLPLDAALDVARQVCAGLAAAHQAGIVHRDVSAANVFLTEHGPVKLLDFGLAVLAGAADEGVVQGTVSGMSPEQARGAAVDARTDVWAVGVLLHRMLTGRVPFPGDSGAEVLAQVMAPGPSPSLRGHPGVPDRVAQVVDRALSKDPDVRFADAGDLLDALDRASVPPVPVWRRVAVPAVAVLALAALGWALLRSPASVPAGTPEVRLVLEPVGDLAVGPAARDQATGVIEEVGSRLTALGRIQVVTADEERDRWPEAWHLEVATLALTERPELGVVLRDGHRGLVRWSGSYPFTTDRLAATGRALSADLLAELGIALTPRDQAILAASFPADAQAYSAFLVGNRLMRLRTPESVTASLARYEEASRRDSTFVPALARQAYAMALLLDWGWPHPELDRATLLARSRAASDQALARDSSSAEAWLARAYTLVAMDPVRSRGAVEAFQRAVALDPYNGEAFHQYGQALMVLGRWPEARTAYRRALELDPGYAMSLIGLAGLHELAGERTRTRQALDSAVAVAPEMAFTVAMRGLLHALDGEFDHALTAGERALALDPSFPVPALGVLAMAHAGLGDSASAREMAVRAHAAAGDPDAPTPDEAYFIVLALEAVGWRERAVATVEQARPRGANLWYLFQQPVFAKLREDPRVAAILTEADPRPAPVRREP